MKKSLRSEAAIKRVIKQFDEVYAELRREGFACLVTFFEREDTHLTWPIAELDLREFVKKRAALTGIKKQVDKIVRGSKVKKKTK